MTLNSFTNQLNNIYIHTWHQAAIEQVKATLGNDRLAHALLVSGVPGIGKRQFAETLAQYLLCQEPRDDGLLPCGVCKACHMFGAGTHPDALSVVPEGAAGSIRVDAIRALVREMALTAQFGNRRVALIAPADAMNVNAANSLLKTLEEPPAGTFLILVTARPGLLLPTVRSRCQSIRLHAPEPAHALPWLQAQLGEDAPRWLSVARGAPLRALEMAGEQPREFRDTLLQVFCHLVNGDLDPVRAAAKYARCELVQLLEWLDAWTTDLIRLRCTDGTASAYNQDLGERLKPSVARLDTMALFGYLDHLRLIASGSAALNTQLAVEDVFIRASRLPRPATE